MRLFNILDFSNVVIAQLQAPNEFIAWNQAIHRFGHYYNLYIVETR